MNLYTIRPGKQIQIGDVVYNPPRNGPTVWEIGIPDRTASEFYIPDPDPGFMNKLYINHTEKYVHTFFYNLNILLIAFLLQ